MKRLLLVAFLLSSVLTQAQTEKIIGSWLLTKVEVGEEIHEPYFITDFNEDGKMESMGMEVGTWKFDKNSNTIIMQSTVDKDFNGENKIVSITESELVLDKDGAKLFYTRINNDKIKTNNEQANLEGVWDIQNTEDITSLLKFELPDSFTLIKSSDGSTETSKGTWIFNPDESSIIFIGFSELLRGKKSIKELTEKKLVLENNGTIITAEKEEANTNSIERLTFNYDEFSEEETNNAILPWSNFEEMLSYLSDVKMLKYKYGTLIEEMGTLKYSTIITRIDVNNEEEDVSFSNFTISQNDTMQISEDYKGGLAGSYNDFFPRREIFPFRIVGVENVTVPAGSFECTIVEGFDSEDQIKYWMINDKPGVYAKIITERIGAFDKLEYTLFELEEIK